MEILRMNCGNAFQISLYLENRMTNRASYIGAQREYMGQKKLFRFYVWLAGFFHRINQPHKFLCGVGNGNVVVFSFRNFFLKICAKCFIPVADILGSIDQSKTQIA